MNVLLGGKQRTIPCSSEVVFRFNLDLENVSSFKAGGVILWVLRFITQKKKKHLIMCVEIFGS